MTVKFYSKNKIQITAGIIYLYHGSTVHINHLQVKKCLVIGGGGFLGHHIVERLLDSGYKVNVFDIRETYEDDRVQFFVGDLCNKEASINKNRSRLIYCFFF